MEALHAEHEKLEKRGNLSKTIADLQRTIDLLSNARDAVANDPDTASVTLAKLKNPVKQSFDKVNDDMKEVHSAMNKYGKALEKKFKNVSLPTAGNDVMGQHPTLINRAIAMHLLREGNFSVASTFVEEVKKDPNCLDVGQAMDVIQNGEASDPDAMDRDERPESAQKHMERQFADMYNILNALRNEHNLGPAIEWARQHSEKLEQRGSNLEFELSRLKFVELYTTEELMSDNPFEGPLRALEYARSTFSSLSSRYVRETSSLLGSLAYSPGLQDSPYRALFYNQAAWEEVSASFTREFCGMLGLSERSPLYTAVTAGGIALPVLEKYERVMAQARSQWTSINELPVRHEAPSPFQITKYANLKSRLKRHFHLPTSSTPSSSAQSPKSKPRTRTRQ